MRNYKQIILVVVLLFSIFTPFTKVISAPQQIQTKKPNFLFIAIDDLNDFVGFMAEEEGNFLQTIYPDPAVRKQIAERITPNLNRLAKESTPFLRAYTASPLCNPSRTALLTGVRNHRNGISGNQLNFRDVPELKELVTLPEYLKANGYFTAGVGKIFHKPVYADNTDWTDSAKSWSKFVMRRTGTGEGTENSPYTPADAALQEPSLFRFGTVRAKPEQTNDYQNADLIARVLENNTATIEDYQKNQQTITLEKDKPFFLAAGIFRPHLPWKAPQRYFDAFPTEEMTGITQETFQKVLDDLKDIPQSGINTTDFIKGDFKRLMQWADSQKLEGGKIQAWRVIIQAYLACIKFADDCVGRLINGLEKSQYRDNTITVLWSDHGYHIGDKLHGGKVTMWEAANRVVLLIKNPLIKQQKGKAVTQPVSLIDLYPTIVKMSGSEIPKQVDGRDISFLLSDANKKAAEYTLSSINGNLTLRSAEWRFTRYRNGEKELYNEKTDPFELINLATKQEYKNILVELESKIDQMLKEKPILFDPKNIVQTDKENED